MTADEIAIVAVKVVLTGMLMVINFAIITTFWDEDKDSERKTVLDRLSQKFNVSKAFFIFWGTVLIVPVWIGIYKLLKFFLYTTTKFLILTSYQFIKSSIDMLFTKQSKKPTVVHNTTNIAPFSSEIQPVIYRHKEIPQIIKHLNKYSKDEICELNMKFQEATLKKKKLIFEIEPDKKQQLNQQFEIL